MKTQTFKSLPDGQTFDFISPNAMHNSFTKRCTKISARKYQDEDGTTHKVGTINATVYHVGCPICFGGHPAGCCAQDGKD